MTQNNSIGADHLPSPVFSRLSNDDTVQISTTLPTPLLSRLDNDQELSRISSPTPTVCWPCGISDEETLTAAAHSRPMPNCSCFINADEELTVSTAPVSPCQCWVGQSTKLAPIPVYCSFSSDEELSASGPQPQPGRCVPTCYISEN